MKIWTQRLLCGLFSFLALGVALQAATYLPLSDKGLALGAPVIVRAEVVSQEVGPSPINGKEYPFTTVTLQTIEAVKGSPPARFRVRLPGGRIENVIWSLPGTPAFEPRSEVVLFLFHPADAEPDEFSLTEFGMSKFDILEDETGRRFAVRPGFSPGTDEFLSERAEPPPASDSRAEEFREAGSFLQALRAAAQGQRADVGYEQPKGRLRHPHEGPSRAWVNIGGPEGRDGLSRWFWDTGESPTGVVAAIGTQSNLTDRSNGITHIYNAVNQWRGVSGADVRYGGVYTSGNVTVYLDVFNPPQGFWKDPSDTGPRCGGVLGLGGPGPSRGPRSFRGDRNYYAPSSGDVWMRKSNCPTGYDAATFRSVVLHELGHTLGLGHPDQGQSMHSRTTPSDWNAAVMASSVRPSKPDTPQADDIQAIQYYYGTGGPGPTPPPTPTPTPIPCMRPAILTNPQSQSVPAGASATISVAAGGAVPLTYQWYRGASGNTGSPIGGATGASYVTPPVTNTTSYWARVTNACGSADSSAAVVSLAPAVACSAESLCLNGRRFTVTLRARDQRTGNTGVGHAIPQNDLFGYFSIPTLTSNPANPEVFVKVLGPASGKYWVFYGGLTDLEYTLTVRDTRTGGVRTYRKEPGSACGGFDTDAFAAGTVEVSASAAQTPDSGEGAFAEEGARWPSPDESLFGTAASIGSCLPGSDTLCLNGGRFRLTLTARDQRTGRPGGGQAISQNDFFGYFSIPALTGNPGNPEVFVKVLGPVEGSYWVFYGGLTDLEYAISVTDTETLRVKTYLKEPGSACGGFDTAAFPPAPVPTTFLGGTYQTLPGATQQSGSACTGMPWVPSPPRPDPASQVIISWDLIERGYFLTMDGVGGNQLPRLRYRLIPVLRDEASGRFVFDADIAPSGWGYFCAGTVNVPARAEGRIVFQRDRAGIRVNGTVTFAGSLPQCAVGSACPTTYRDIFSFNHWLPFR